MSRFLWFTVYMTMWKKLSIPVPKPDLDPNPKFNTLENIEHVKSWELPA